MLEILIVTMSILVPLDIARGILGGSFDFRYTKQALKLAARLMGRLMVAIGNRLTRIR